MLYTNLPDYDDQIGIHQEKLMAKTPWPPDGDALDIWHGQEFATFVLLSQTLLRKIDGVEKL